MHGEIIAIGDELVSGKTVNTTSSFAARRLFDSGYSIRRITVIGDDIPLIVDCLHKAISRSRFLIITGGLGPTADDITNEAVSRALDLPLVENHQILEKISECEKHHGLSYDETFKRKLSMLPEGAELLNPDGHAAGYMMMHESIPMFFLPGVPNQLENHVVEQVIPRLRNILGAGRSVMQKTFKIFGLSEIEVNARLSRIESRYSGLSMGYYPNFPEVHVTVTLKGQSSDETRSACLDACSAIRDALGRYVIAEDEETLEAVTGRLLVEKQAMVSVAESCTGGLLGQRLTDVSGSSAWFDRGVTTYTNRSKEEMLGVPREVLERYGAVSTQVAESMADGIRRLSGTAYALSITGIAGPTGGSREKPVGTVYIALATPERTEALRFFFPGGRDKVRVTAAETALDWLRRHLADGSYIPGYKPA